MIKGAVLRPSARTQVLFAARWRELIEQMEKETKRELIALFRQPDAVVYDAQDTDVITRQARELGLLQEPPAPEAIAMDASLAELAERLLNRVMAKFTIMFDNAAPRIVTPMIDDTLKNSETGLRMSLKEASKEVTLKMTPRVAQMVDAGAAESTALIKSVPAKYIAQVQGDVMRSITTGNGLQDLIPALEKQNVKTLNWAANVARDQTRKVYNNVNKARMQDAGVNKFEWIHSGGSNKPRKYHLDHAPAGLNGGIFSFDDPPIIDESTGERGIPGQLPYCGCTMRPIIDLSNEEGTES